jgi:hypothetical protein
MSAKGYGRTNVSKAKAVSNREKWQAMLDQPRGTEFAKKPNPTLYKTLVEYRKNGGKVSKPTALKIYRTFGFRVPYGKPKGKPRKRSARQTPVTRKAFPKLFG